MKIWWPWRKKQLVPPLFEPRLGHNANAPVVNFAEQNGKPHPKNALGPFYVLNEECITCGAPHVTAPDLMGWDLDVDGAPRHCYFKKQPETPGEVERAIRAIHDCCCGALVYEGTNGAIIKQLRKAGDSHAIVRRK